MKNMNKHFERAFVDINIRFIGEKKHDLSCVFIVLNINILYDD